MTWYDRTREADKTKLFVQCALADRKITPFYRRNVHALTRLRIPRKVPKLKVSFKIYTDKYL